MYMYMCTCIHVVWHTVFSIWIPGFQRVASMMHTGNNTESQMANVQNLDSTCVWRNLSTGPIHDIAHTSLDVGGHSPYHWSHKSPYVLKSYIQDGVWNVTTHYVQWTFCKPVATCTLCKTSFEVTFTNDNWTSTYMSSRRVALLNSSMWSTPIQMPFKQYSIWEYMVATCTRGTQQACHILKNGTSGPKCVENTLWIRWAECVKNISHVIYISNQMCWTYISGLALQGLNLSMGSGPGHCLGMKHNMVTVAPQGCYSEALELQL